MVKLAFWKVRSAWDLFAFPSLLQWPVGVLAFVTAVAGLRSVSVALFMAVMALSGFSLLTVVATVMGSKQHGHMAPGIGYHLTALIAGPVVGVHYLWRTGQAE